MAKKNNTELSSGLDDENELEGLTPSEESEDKPKKEKKVKKEKEKKEALPKDFFDALQDVMGDKFDIHNMDTFEPVPFFISTGSYAINWIIANDMINGGFPATKLSLVTGECLAEDQELTLQVPDEIVHLF